MAPSYSKTLPKKLPQLSVHDHLWNQAQTQILNSDFISKKSSNRSTDNLNSIENNTKQPIQTIEENNRKSSSLIQTINPPTMSNRYQHQNTIINGNNIQLISPQNTPSPSHPYPLNVNNTSLMQQQQQQLIANTLLQQQAKNQKNGFDCECIRKSTTTTSFPSKSNLYGT